jgi:hypothetical protein
MELLVKNIKNNKYFYLKDEWYIPCDTEYDISYNKKFVEKSDDFSKINVSDIVEEGEEIYYINVDTSLQKDIFSITKHHQLLLSGNIFVSEKQASKHQKYYLETLLEKSIPIEKVVIHDMFISDDISYIKDVLKKYLI